MVENSAKLSKKSRFVRNRHGELTFGLDI